MNSITFPQIDMLTVSRNSREQRKSTRNIVPPGLTCADYGRLTQVDDFYNDCQDMRDYYRDPLNKLQKPIIFKQHHGKCKVSFNRNTELLSLPMTHVRQYQPIICSVDYGSRMRFDEGFRLGGRYDPVSSTAFKR